MNLKNLGLNEQSSYLQSTLTTAATGSPPANSLRLQPMHDFTGDIVSRFFCGSSIKQGGVRCGWFFCFGKAEEKKEKVLNKHVETYSCGVVPLLYVSRYTWHDPVGPFIFDSKENYFSYNTLCV